MLVDFFPARTGSLSYIILLNKAFKVDLSPCLSSFTYAFLFDQLAMAPLLAMAILIDSLTSHKNYLWLWGIALLIMVIALLLILSLGPLVKIFSKWSGRNNHRWQKYPRLRKLDHQLHNLTQSFSILKQAKIFWLTLGLSVMIRGVKYLYLYILLSAVLQALYGHWIQLPFWVVLLGLVASEASAGLPISGIAGFGFYEGILGAVLSTQGIHPSQAVLVSFAMHFITQIVDYSWGGGALIYILIRWAGAEGNGSGAVPLVLNKNIRPAVIGGVISQANGLIKGCSNLPDKDLIVGNVMLMTFCRGSPDQPLTITGKPGKILMAISAG